MSGAIPSLPQYAFMAWCSVKKKHKDNLPLLSYNLNKDHFIEFGSVQYD